MVCAPIRIDVRKQAALILGLLSLAHILTACKVFKCEGSFYRSTPPLRFTESGLEKRCHSLGAGRDFASLYHPGRQVNVYTALHLGQHNAWGKGRAEKSDKPGETEVLGEKAHVHVPALYKKDRNVASAVPTSPFDKLDALTAELVESRTMPECSKAGGSVYIQSGVGGLDDTKADVLWSAVCCDVPNGPGSFNMGVVQDGKGGVNLISLAKLEELVDIKELFSGGCIETGSIKEEALKITEVLDEDKFTAEGDGDGDSDVDEVTSTTAQRTESTLEESGDKTESSESQKDSVMLYVLSTTFSILCAPVSPVIFTIINIPSQICYVLQEDAAVLASLPRKCFSLVQNLGSGVISGVENVGSVAYQVGEYGVCSLYTLLSMLVGAFLLSCQEGLVGTGSLIGYALEIVTSALGEVWDIGTDVVGCMFQGVVGYFGVVGSEMCEQGWSMGKGLGMLVWRGQRGIVHVISTAVDISGGILGNMVVNIQDSLKIE